MKKFWNFFTDIAALHVWLAVYCNSNSKLEKITENSLSIKKGQCGIHTFHMLKYLLTRKYSR